MVEPTRFAVVDFVDGFHYTHWREVEDGSVMSRAEHERLMKKEIDLHEAERQRRHQLAEEKDAWQDYAFALAAWNSSPKDSTKRWVEAAQKRIDFLGDE